MGCTEKHMGRGKGWSEIEGAKRPHLRTRDLTHKDLNLGGNAIRQLALGNARVVFADREAGDLGRTLVRTAAAWAELELLQRTLVCIRIPRSDTNE